MACEVGSLQVLGGKQLGELGAGLARLTTRPDQPAPTPLVTQQKGCGPEQPFFLFQGWTALSCAPATRAAAWCAA